MQRCSTVCQAFILPLNVIGVIGVGVRRSIEINCFAPVDFWLSMLTGISRFAVK